MDGNVEASRPHRVIALLCATTAAPQPDADVELVRVNSSYEAAAELLAAPASALLVDLARITPTHVPLLGLAGELAVPVVAFGTVSADLKADVLAHIRLVALERVGDTLAEILKLPLPSAAGGQAEKPEVAARPPPVQRPASRSDMPAPTVPFRPGRLLTQEELDALLLDEL